MIDALRQAVQDVSSRLDVRQAVREIYTDLQNQIDARRPVCIASGRCCRFEEFGHRLFVTTLELAAFVGELAELKRQSSQFSLAFQGWGGVGCPFQIFKLCGVHGIRPFGCRVFFCDATSTEWQAEQYRHFHERLKELHQTLSVPYFCMEWRTALQAAEVSI
jgi:Fe-S-cluster containining protein